MIRRPKSFERSRRNPVRARIGAGRTHSPGSEESPDDDFPAWSGLAADAPTESAAAPSDDAALSLPAAPPRAVAAAPAGHAPTGWDWFAQWPFPTHLLLFSIVIAAGMWWTDRPEAPSITADPVPAAQPMAKLRPRLRPETFDWLNRLRETQIVTDQLESEFADAQQFYREYALDEFLDFDPWSLGSDEVITLTHFCDQGFFTVEREILVKILERKLLDQPTDARSARHGAIDRLEAAARDREARLASLHEAAELYRRGRAAEVSLPGSLTPEEDQSRRAALVDKLAVVRRERDRLDTRIAGLNASLR